MTLGIVANTPAEARAAAEKLGVVVVKAQVKAGGRGKAGGVKLAKTPDEAEEHATAILGMQIKGLTVNRVLIAPAASIVEEYYFSFLLDRADRQYLCIASVEGGVEIEEVAKTNPDAVKKIPINPGTGVDEEKARAIVAEAKFPEALTEQAVTMVQKLWQVFVEEDATLVEVNPLARLEGDVLEALDGKVSLDENAEFRHEEHAAFEIKRGGRRRSRRRPRTRASTTSSSTVPSASSATARAWSCRPSTSSRTPARSTAASSRPTSSTSAAAPTPR